jgi:hypothetical protein
MSKEEHAKNSVHEKEETKEEASVQKLGNRLDKGLKDDLKGLILLH